MIRRRVMKSVIPVLVFYRMLLPLGHMLVYCEGNLIMLKGADKRSMGRKDDLLSMIEPDSLVLVAKKSRGNQENLRRARRFC